MGSRAPDVSIVIPVYNRRAEVERCLESVIAQEFHGTREIICVDNGSTDGTLEALGAYPVRVITCGERSAGAARNAGWREARGGIIVMTDSDCVAEPGWLGALVEPFSDPDTVITGGRIEALHVEFGTTLWAASYQVLEQARFTRGEPAFPPFAATANAAFRREALERAEGFDPALRSCEDADLSWRILDAGGRIVYCPDAVVRHKHRESLAEFYEQARAYGAAGVELFSRHGGRMGLRALVHWDNIIALGTLPFRILWFAAVGPTSWERRKRVYEAIWRTGFTLAQIRHCARRGVLFV